MQVYRREIKEILRRFLANRLTFPECIALLDSALADVESRLTGVDLLELHALVLTNNEIIMLEMQRRAGLLGGTLT